MALFPLLSISLFSCGNTKSDDEILNGYEISKGEVLKEQKIFKTAYAVSVTAFEEFTIDGLNWHWDYNESPLFAKDDCKLSKDELQAFARTYKYESNFEETQYKCDGTDFYTYAKKIYEPTAKYNIKKPEDGIYAPYYVSDLQEYTITVKSSKESFKVYGVTGEGPHIELIKQGE